MILLQLFSSNTQLSHTSFVLLPSLQKLLLEVNLTLFAKPRATQFHSHHKILPYQANLCQVSIQFLFLCNQE